MPITGLSQRMSLNVEKHFDAGWSGAGNCGAGGGRSGLGGITVATLEENVGDDATFFTISQAEFVSIQQSTSTGYRVLIVWFLCNETSFSSMKCGISSTIAALSTAELPTAEAMYGTLATSNVTISLVTIGTPGVECWGDGRGGGCAGVASGGLGNKAGGKDGGLNTSTPLFVIPTTTPTSTPTMTKQIAAIRKTPLLVCHHGSA
eukprot:2032377-Prymnesium_polylepis.1